MIGRSDRDAGRWGRTLSGYSILDPWAALFMRNKRGVAFQSCTFTNFLYALWYRRNRKTAYECL